MNMRLFHFDRIKVNHLAASLVRPQMIDAPEVDLNRLQGLVVEKGGPQPWNLLVVRRDHFNSLMDSLPRGLPRYGVLWGVTRSLDIGHRDTCAFFRHNSGYVRREVPLCFSFHKHRDRHAMV